MWVPFITKFSIRQTSDAGLKGGGGGGGGGHGGSGHGGEGSSGGGHASGEGSSGSSSGGAHPGSGGGGGTVAPSGAAGRGSFSSTGSSFSAYSYGGGLASSIPAGSAFQGRSIGGGTRDQIYGTRMYGSGYPGFATAAVASRPFPFYFWPVVWGSGWHHPYYYSHAPYLHSHEYGDANNSSRPGGPLSTAWFQPGSGPNATYFVISDTNTVQALTDEINAKCDTWVKHTHANTTVWPYFPDDPTYPQPESVVQYYRGSSIALTLQGYNNSAAVAGDNSTKPDDPLPNGLDMSFLNCLNTTIGQAAPLLAIATPVSSLGSATTAGFMGPLCILLLTVLHLA